jgi:hypothetical protein
MSAKLPELASCSGALVVEIQPDPHAPLPTPLTRVRAETLTAALATDLERVCARVAEVGLVAVGALYDQTEVLKIGFPLTEALESLYRGTVRDGVFEPRVMALGCDAAEPFPIAVLNPAQAGGAGPLLLMPFSLVGPSPTLAPVARELEEQLLHAGTVAPETRRMVAEYFGVRPLHMSLVTLADLCALLQVQLENVDLLPLWHLLEHSLLGREGAQRVDLPPGNMMVAIGDDAHAAFQSFDAWALARPGTKDLQQGYVAWVRSQRQYLAALQAYGFRLHQRLPSDSPAPGEKGIKELLKAPELTGHWYQEDNLASSQAAAAARVLITDQFDPEVGTVAYTLDYLDRRGQSLGLSHYYPLSPEGLHALIDHLRADLAEHDLPYQVLHPERLCHDPQGTGLRSAPAGPGREAGARRH